MADIDIVKEIQKLVENLTKLGVEITVDNLTAPLKQAFDTFVVLMREVVNEENIQKVMELQDTIIELLTPIITPIVNQVLGIAKKPMGSSDESVMEEVNEVIMTLVMVGLVITVVALLPELAHPLKRIGLGRISPIIVQMGGFDRISANIMNILVERTMGARLRYATNSIFMPYIPNQQDLVRFTVREVLTPSELELYMKKLGFSPEWSQNYWAAHWELVSVSSLYKMYHRDIIEERHLRKMLERHDYDSQDPIFEGETINWQENLVALSHILIPRVDLRYAWEAGLINDEDFGKRMKQLGYSEQDAIIETEIQMRRTLTEEINAVRREYINDYKEGIITRSGFLDNLTTLGDTQRAKDYRAEAAEYFQERDHKKAMINEIEKALGRGNITEKSAQDELVALGVEEWRRAQIVELAALKLRLQPENITYLG